MTASINNSHCVLENSDNVNLKEDSRPNFRQQQLISQTNAFANDFTGLRTFLASILPSALNFSDPIDGPDCKLFPNKQSITSSFTFKTLAVHLASSIAGLISGAGLIIAAPMSTLGETIVYNERKSLLENFLREANITHNYNDNNHHTTKAQSFLNKVIPNAIQNNFENLILKSTLYVTYFATSVILFSEMFTMSLSHDLGEDYNFYNPRVVSAITLGSIGALSYITYFTLAIMRNYQNYITAQEYKDDLSHSLKNRKVAVL